MMIVALAAMVPKAVAGRDRPAAEHGWTPRSDLRSPSRLDTAAIRLGRQDKPAVHGRGEPSTVGGAEIASIVADEGL
jgi:hypothetical protein